MRRLPDNDYIVTREEANKNLGRRSRWKSTTQLDHQETLTTPQSDGIDCVRLTALCNNSFTPAWCPACCPPAMTESRLLVCVHRHDLRRRVSFVISFVDSRLTANTLTVKGFLPSPPDPDHHSRNIYAVAAMVFIGCIMGGAATCRCLPPPPCGCYTFRSVLRLDSSYNELFGSLGKLLTARAAKSAQGFNLAFGLGSCPFALI